MSEKNSQSCLVIGSIFTAAQNVQELFCTGRYVNAKIQQENCSKTKRQERLKIGPKNETNSTGNKTTNKKQTFD